MKRAIIVLCLGLGACAGTTDPQPVQTQIVREAVPVRCDPKLSAKPDYPDTDVALRNAPNIFVRVQLLLAGRVMRTKREDELDAAVAACKGG